MKNIFFLSLICFACITLTHAQNRNGFGFKAGLNYNANGDYIESIGAIAEHPDRGIGYHFGVFGKLGGKIFFKPELVYTATKSNYDSETFKLQKIDAPLLIGLRFLRLANIFAGPSLQYILESDFDGISIDSLENDFTVGLNIGVGITIYKIGVDLRYEQGLSDNVATFIGNDGLESRIDTRPSQLILSISLLL